MDDNPTNKRRPRSGRQHRAQRNNSPQDSSPPANRRPRRPTNSQKRTSPPSSKKMRRPPSGRQRTNQSSTDKVRVPKFSKVVESGKKRVPRNLKTNPGPRPKTDLEQRVDRILTEILVLEVNKSGEIKTQTIPYQQPSKRVEFDPMQLVGTKIKTPNMPYDLRVTEYMTSGGMSHIYIAIAEKDGQLLTSENATGIEKRLAPPPFVLKVCKDKCDKDNEQLLSSAKFFQQLQKKGTLDSCYPVVFQSGTLKEARLQDRRPTYLITELLYPNPIHYLKLGRNPDGRKLIGPNEGLHPQLSLLILTDILRFIQSLHKEKKAHNDLHIGQVLLRMSPLRKGNELSDYLRKIDAGQFETVVPDCDTITDLNLEQEKLYFTPGYGDPWIVQDRKSTRKKDAYGAMATFFALIMGHRLQPEHEIVQGDPRAAIDWIKHVTKLAPPLFAGSEKAPLFTRQQLYAAISKHTPVEIQNKEKPKTGLFSRMFRLSEKETLASPDQKHTEAIYRLLNYGLSSPDVRKTPQALLKSIEDGFPWEQTSYVLYDTHNHTYSRKTRRVPFPFTTTSYHSRF